MVDFRKGGRGSMLRRTFLLLALLVAGAEGVAADQMAMNELLPELRKGGHVIYFRHGETGAAYADRATAVIGDCTTQRNLNEAGRRQVAQLGAAFKSLAIPVGTVLSSEFCRCWQHADAMFGKDGYIMTADLNLPPSYPSVNDADRELNNRNLRRLLAEAPRPDTNTVLVSHGANIRLLTGYHPNLEGEAVIFRPDGRGGFTRVAAIRPDAWPAPQRDPN
jgi:broad specificity phosphatase PhoE